MAGLPDEATLDAAPRYGLNAKKLILQAMLQEAAEDELAGDAAGQGGHRTLARGCAEAAQRLCCAELRQLISAGFNPSARIQFAVDAAQAAALQEALRAGPDYLNAIDPRERPQVRCTVGLHAGVQACACPAALRFACVQWSFGRSTLLQPSPGGRRLSIRCFGVFF